MGVDELVGPAPGGWEYTTLAVACERGGGGIQTGPFGSQLHAGDYVAVGIPSIMPQNIGDNRVVEDGIARIRPEDAERLSRYLVRTGDIVYSRRGDVERRALVREHEDGWLCGTGCLRVRLGDQGPDSRFTAYYLAHPAVREWIVRHAHGATMPNLNTSILGACPLLLPPLSEQRAIAHILGTLDDKIELNRRMNETLEAMARALFKSWFVDFDPVRAKAEGRDPGIPQPLADLFSSCLVDSEIGEIPEGWEVRSLDSIGRFLNGLALQKHPPIDERSLPVVKIAQLRTGNTVGADRASADLSPDYIIEDGDLLFSWSGSLGCVLWAGGRGALNQHLFKVTSVEFPKWLCYLGVRNHLPDFRRIAAGKATTMGHIQRHHLAEAQLAVPPRDLLRAMGSLMAPMIKSLWKRQRESRMIALVRDTMLPKLISGEINSTTAPTFTEIGQ